MYEPRTYQRGATVAPVGVTDYETARVQVFRPGFGWVDRPADPEPEPVEDECQGAA